jgi:two-component system CAI-1 autoinducer sensor kinase/phosphatase CqsS
VESPNVAALREVWIYPFPVYLTALIVGSITNRNVHVVQSEQLRAASAIGSNIAHELRTPLASIRVLAHGIGRFLPDLVGAYERAKSAQIHVEPISEAQLDRLASGLQSIQAEVDYSNTIIDMLLANTSEKPATADTFAEFRISEAIEEAVKRFPFNNSLERRLLSYSVESDFVAFAPKPLVVHVLFNLIKNALYYVQKSGQGTLELAAREIDGAGVVEVMDTGTGIPANLQPRIFDRFFSSDPSSQGAGIGLSFCKMVMESIGGEIRCDSREGEYTIFRLTFPSASNQRKHAAIRGADHTHS